jgi:hypothetical protein
MIETDGKGALASRTYFIVKFSSKRNEARDVGSQRFA